jgi:hypothetical protein
VGESNGTRTGWVSSLPPGLGFWLSVLQDTLQALPVVAGLEESARVRPEREYCAMRGMHVVEAVAVSFGPH